MEDMPDASKTWAGVSSKKDSRPQFLRADGAAGGNLRAAAASPQFPELVIQGERLLHGIPPPRQARVDGLTPVDLHPEAFETQRPRTFEQRIVRILEPVTCLVRATPGTERFTAAMELRWPPAGPRPGVLEWKLL